jgi:hypothetical protein
VEQNLIVVQHEHLDQLLKSEKVIRIGILVADDGSGYVNEKTLEHLRHVLQYGLVIEHLQNLHVVEIRLVILVRNLLMVVR